MRLTEELARSGNTQAVNFRPGLQLAIEAVVKTDAFRSIFRTAVRRTHAAILTGYLAPGVRAAAGFDCATISATI